MEKTNIPINPGRMISDVTETELGVNQHLEVKNLRQVKHGEWESVDGNSIYMSDSGTPPDLSDVKNATEFTLDRTSERFILLQKGGVNNQIFRYDYSSGYTTATEQAINLPSGVTIPSGNKLRFFYFRGVIRITGATEPLWYGYIKRTLFQQAWAEHYKNDFNTAGDENDFTATDMTLSRDTTNYIEGTASLGMLASGAVTGTAYRQITVTAGTKYRLFMSTRADAANTDPMTIQVGSDLGSGIADYGFSNIPGDGKWYHWSSYEITPTGSSIYIHFELSPGDKGNAEYIILQENSSINIDGWYLEKASVSVSQINADNLAAAYGPDYATTRRYSKHAKFSAIFDESQYSVASKFNRAFSLSSGSGINFITGLDNDFGSGKSDLHRYDIVIPGTNIKTSFPYPRMSGIDSFFSVEYSDDGYPDIDESKLLYNLNDVIDFTESKEYTFDIDNKWRYDSTYKNRLYLGTTLGDPMYLDFLRIAVDQKIRFKKTDSNVEVITVVTGVTINFSDPYLSYIELAIKIFESGIVTSDVTQSISNWAVTIERYINYDSTIGYTIRDVVGIGQTISFKDTTGFSQNVLDASPNYRYHAIIDEIAYCSSLESDEEDMLRNSPVYQYDVFPENNIIQTQVGDADSIKAIVKRGDRLMILKRHSISQGNFIGGRYNEDIGISKNGLYSTDGFIVLGSTLFFLDRDDLYAYYGAGDPKPVMKQELMREKYRANVSENSIIAYNKLDNELWLILNGIILVWHIERDEWFIRETNITILYAFLDYDQKMIAGGATDILNFNNTATPYNESISWSFTTRLIDFKTPYSTKKASEFRIPVKGSEDINVIFRDPDKATTKTITKTPDTGTIKVLKFRPKFLNKQLEITVSNVSGGTSSKSYIRGMELEVERWK